MTQQGLVDDLLRLGVKEGQTLLVHASVGSIGLEEGGASVLLSALLEAVGGVGNIVVPTMTMENSVTSRAHRKLVERKTEEEARAFELAMPGFDKDATPSTTGAFGEALRNFNGAKRSAHPQSSFAAIGPKAEELMADHHRDCHLGEDSPLAKLYEMDALVLLVGVGYEACTAFHLAEYRYVPSPPMYEYSCVVIENGARKWIKYWDVVLNDQDFLAIGLDLDRAYGAPDEIVNVGKAPSRLIPLVLAVDHATQWMAKYRTPGSVALRGNSFYSGA